ncbi:S ribonuclease [Pyrus ussuriensis x Pyrus communis]|uniref:S ribonuclease n=1 Tax=Pyrus ussuriensis x Pyrus communis TaxID=2448454 RepID=A0A5N5GXZ8_9ROSA|nr:S ribonuclease [Pyrus ussuriensis x Pyrus communis]
MYQELRSYILQSPSFGRVNSFHLIILGITVWVFPMLAWVVCPLLSITFALGTMVFITLYKIL